MPWSLETSCRLKLIFVLQREQGFLLPCAIDCLTIRQVVKAVVEVVLLIVEA